MSIASPMKRISARWSRIAAGARPPAVAALVAPVVARAVAFAADVARAVPVAAAVARAVVLAADVARVVPVAPAVAVPVAWTPLGLAVAGELAIKPRITTRTIKNTIPDLCMVHLLKHVLG